MYSLVQRDSLTWWVKDMVVLISTQTQRWAKASTILSELFCVQIRLIWVFFGPWIHRNTRYSVFYIMVYATTCDIRHQSQVCWSGRGWVFTWAYTEWCICYTRIQRILNKAICLISRLDQSEHITSTPLKLHRLPIHASIEYEIVLMTCKNLNDTCPDYMSTMLLFKQHTPLPSHTKAFTHNIYFFFLSVCPAGVQSSLRLLD